MNLTATDLVAHAALGITPSMLARAQVCRVDDVGARERLSSTHPGDLGGLLYPYLSPTNGYDFTGPTRFDKLFTGIAVETPAWVKEYTGDRRGFEDTGPEDTFDGDYARLLERAYEKNVKVLASPTGFEPVF